MKCPNCGFDMKFANVTNALRKAGHHRAFQIWTPEEEHQLVEMARQAKSILEISAALGRHTTSIQKRLSILGVEIAKAPPPDTAQWPTEEEQLAAVQTTSSSASSTK